jgi:Putative inner membrane exporter, YdcZ
VPVQFAVNAEMRSVVGGPIVAAAISFLIGTVALIVAVLVAREGVPAPADLAGAPWWAWSGGFLGGFYVAASIILTPASGRRRPSGLSSLQDRWWPPSSSTSLVCSTCSYIPSHYRGSAMPRSSSLAL